MSSFFLSLLAGGGTPPQPPDPQGAASLFDSTAPDAFTVSGGVITRWKDHGSQAANLVPDSGSPAPLLGSDSGIPTADFEESSLLRLVYPTAMPVNYTVLLVYKALGIRVGYQFPLRTNAGQNFFYLEYGSIRSHWGMGYGGAGFWVQGGWNLAAYSLKNEPDGSIWYQTGTSGVNVLKDDGNSGIIDLDIGNAWMKVAYVEVIARPLSAPELAAKVAQLQTKYAAYGITI